MIKKAFILLLICSSHQIIAQDSLTADIKQWVMRKDPQSVMDISSGFYYDDCSYLGAFGKNRYKINIRFDSVKEKGGTQNYYIEGSSLLKKKVTPFKGILHVDHLDLLHVEDGFYELIAVATGTYTLTEDTGGVFKGVFRKYFSYHEDNQTFKEANMEVSDYEGFAGVWIDPSNGKEYDCHFGFQRYPLSLVGDFEINGGEPSINPDYKKHGWDAYFKKNGGHGFYGNTECNYNWWK